MHKYLASFSYFCLPLVTRRHKSHSKPDRATRRQQKQADKEARRAARNAIREKVAKYKAGDRQHHSAELRTEVTNYRETRQSAKAAAQAQAQAHGDGSELPSTKRCRFAGQQQQARDDGMVQLASAKILSSSRLNGGKDLVFGISLLVTPAGESGETLMALPRIVVMKAEVWSILKEVAPHTTVLMATRTGFFLLKKNSSQIKSDCVSPLPISIADLHC